MRVRIRITILGVALSSGGMAWSLQAQNIAVNSRLTSFSAAQAYRGRNVYEARCAACHGGALAGEDAAPPLAGGRFLSNWTNLSLADLAGRIRETMPLDDPATLTGPQTVDIVAYILQANGFSSGGSDLPADPKRLRNIKIDASRASQ